MAQKYNFNDSKQLKSKDQSILTKEVLYKLGVPGEDTMDGLGPEGSHRVLIQSKDLCFYFTSQDDLQFFYDRCLVDKENSEKLVLTNFKEILCFSHGIVKATTDRPFQSQDLFEEHLSKILNSDYWQPTRKKRAHSEFDVMIDEVRDLMVRICGKKSLRFGKRVGDKFQDIVVETIYRNFPNETRPVVCIEVKKPETSGLSEALGGRASKMFEMSVRQAMSYARANHYVRHNIEVRPVCILADGQYFALLNPDLSVEQNIQRITANGKLNVMKWQYEIVNEKFSYLKNKLVEDISEFLGDGKVGLNFPIAITSVRAKPNGTCDRALAENLFKSYNLINAKVKDGKTAIDYTMQVFLLAVLRNCGFVSVSEIDHALFEAKNVSWVHTVLQKWISKNFLPVSKAHLNVFIEAYNISRPYDVRVDAMPQEELGYAYETFINRVNELKLTEFYTPTELVEDVLNELQVQSDDIVFDPTCGCGSFLVAAVKKLFPPGISERAEIKRLSKFISKNVFGNDRDFYAICIAKASLLSLFVERLGVDPMAESGLEMPFIKENFFNQDFFLFDWPSNLKKPTAIIGNAPWGIVSSKSKNREKLVGPDKVWAQVEKIRGPNKEDTHEISGTVVLKCIDEFSGSKKFRFGILVKQQILVKGKDDFLTDPRTVNCYYYDYGHRQLFQHTPSLTAVAFLNTNKKGKDTCKFSLPKLQFGQMIRVTDLGFEVGKGPDTGENEIWQSLAEKRALKDLVVGCLPRNGTCQPMTKPSAGKMVYLAPPNQVNRQLESYAVAHDLIAKNLSEDQRKKLLSVTTGAESKKGKKKTKTKNDFPFSWRRPIKESLLEKDNWKLIFPFQWTGVEIGASRLPMSCTKESVVIRDCHVAFTANPLIDEQIVFNTAAWLSSKVFSQSLEVLCSMQTIKRLSGGRSSGGQELGGYELNPAYSEHIAVPISVLASDELYRAVKKIIGKAIVTTEALNRIDVLVVRALKGESRTQICESGEASRLVGITFKRENIKKKAA